MLQKESKMTNRNKLLCLISFTTVMAIADGCTVEDYDPGTVKEKISLDPTPYSHVDSFSKNPEDCDHDPCVDPDTFHIGCPGYPCAHGSCFEGECVGRTVDNEGYQIDPGVCCDAETCDGPV